MNIKQRGFTLLLAALIASIVLSLATAIFSIAQKQVALASLSQQSQYAFYAADTAAECALYWDIRYGYFGTVTPTPATTLTSPPLPPTPPIPPYCDGQAFTASPVYNAGSPATYPYTQTFQLSLQSGKYCANVAVIKCQGTLADNGACTLISNGPIATQVRAYGFNTPCTAITTNATALERSVQLNY